MKNNWRKKLNIPCKILLVFIGLLLLPLLNAQTIKITSSNIDVVHGYGDIILIDTIYVVELNDSAFGNTDKYASDNGLPGAMGTILIEPVPGYVFDDVDLDIASAGDLYPLENLTYPSGNIQFNFATQDTNSLDSIFILGARLVPTPGAGTWSGNIEVSTDTAGANSHTATASIGPIRMAQPEIQPLVLDSTACELDPLKFIIEIVNDEGTINNEDTLIVTYVTPAGNIFETTILSPTSLEHDLSIDTMELNEVSEVRFIINFREDWTIGDTITIGSSGADVIAAENLPIVFRQGKLIEVSALEERAYMFDFVDNHDQCRYSTENPAHLASYYPYPPYYYYFMPKRSGPGVFWVAIERDNPATGCTTYDTIYFVVSTEMIEVKGVYCYGNDLVDTIKVTKSSINTLVQGDNHGYNGYYYTRFNELKVSALTGTNRIDYTYDISDQYNSNNTYYQFLYYPTGHRDAVTDSTEDVSLVITLTAKMSYQGARYVYEDMLTSPLNGYYCYLRYYGFWTGYRYYCYKYVPEYRDVIIKVGEKSSKIAIPRNDGWLLDYSDTICQNSDLVRLRSNRTIRNITSTIPTSINEEHGIYHFDPSGYRPDTNSHTQITLHYTDENGCPVDSVYTPTIYAVPQADFIADSVCEGSDQPFVQVSPDSNWVDIERWYWDFGDGYSTTNFFNNDVSIPDGLHEGKTFGTYQRPFHRYSTPGIKQIIHGVVSSHGCINYDTTDIVIGEFPTPDFRYSGKLQDRPTTLTNFSLYHLEDPMCRFEYTITDPLNQVFIDTINTFDPYEFTPVQTGVYEVSMVAESRNGCKSTADTLIPVFPVKGVFDDLLYFENFNDNPLPSGWLASQEYLPNITSGWKNVPLAGIFNDGDKQTTGNMWLTGDVSDSINDEAGWLESPCYDISVLNFPMVSMDIFQSLEPGRDGAALLYSVDDGDTWTRLGAQISGTNWYNTIGIFSNPGGTLTTNVGAQGWSETNNEWQLVRHSLDSIKSEMYRSANSAGCVRFRIAYNSNNYTDEEFAGLGIDNFLVGKRKRVVLVEEFINSDYTHTDNRTDLDALEGFLDGKEVEVVDIRYHISTNNQNDEIYDQLYWWQDHSSRASEYAANAWGPMWVMDGVVKNRNSEGYINGINYERALEERALVDPEFEINDVKLTVEGTSLNISATVRKISNHIEERRGPHACQVRMAIVQKEFTDRDGKLHKNVLVDLLPNKEGNVVHTIPAGSEIGYEVVINETWNPGIITVGNEYRLVIYVQGEMHIDEVQQVWFRDLLDTETPQNTSGIESSLANSIRVFPNPVNDKLNITIGSNLDNSGCQWSITSMSGQVIKQGEFFNQENVSVIPVEELSQGIYMLNIITGDGEQLTRKITKITE